MTKKHKIRNVVFVLLGVVLLILKQKYSGSYFEIIRAYLGNFSVSFAVYFIVQFNDYLWKTNKLITAFAAMLIVNLFELTNGFSLMTNVYDPIDMLVNSYGILLALTVDIITNKFFIENNK